MEDQELEKRKKDDKGKKKITAYIRELSVVVAGVAITLGATAWISRQNEKKNMEEYLDAIRIELEENRKETDKIARFYERSDRLSALLGTHGIDGMPEDSLSAYSDVIGQLVAPTFKTSAFDMMNASGSMRQIKDKQLLQSIWNCYTLLERTQVLCNKFMDMKLEEIYRAVLEGGSPVIDDMNNPHHRRLLMFFSIGSGISRLLSSCVGEIEGTLELLKK